MNWQPLNIFSQYDTTVRGLRDDEQETFTNLVAKYHEKLKRNKKRTQYYDAKNKLRDLGISIPPNLLGMLEMSVGWSAKAVDDLAARSVFDGFVISGDDELIEGMKCTLDENNFRGMYPQIVTSELIHSCAFVTVSRGGDDEPEVLINAYSAEHAVAEWDHRLKRIGAGFTVIDTNDKGKLQRVNLYLDREVIEITHGHSGFYVLRRIPNRIGRPLMEPFVNEPSLVRPFGCSRITRPVMSITDSAVRETLRTEVAAEFFTSPQRWAVGVDEGLIDNESPWYAWLGSFLALTVNEEGQNPSVGQFQPTGMSQHIEYMKLLASRFAGETGIPISSLGVIHDNPSSAEAIHAAREDLIIKAEHLNISNGAALRNIGLMVMALKGRKRISDLSAEERSITPILKNPARPSLVSRADAISKLVTAIPQLVGSDVILEEAGFGEDQILRINETSRRFQGLQVFEELRKARPRVGVDEDDSEE